MKSLLIVVTAVLITTVNVPAQKGYLTPGEQAAGVIITEIEENTTFHKWEDQGTYILWHLFVDLNHPNDFRGRGARENIRKYARANCQLWSSDAFRNRLVCYKLQFICPGKYYEPEYIYYYNGRKETRLHGSPESMNHFR